MCWVGCNVLGFNFAKTVLTLVSQSLVPDLNLLRGIVVFVGRTFYRHLSNASTFCRTMLF